MRVSAVLGQGRDELVRWDFLVGGAAAADRIGSDSRGSRYGVSSMVVGLGWWLGRVRWGGGFGKCVCGFHQSKQQLLNNVIPLAVSRDRTALATCG
jgi:hypothetical protein